MLGWHFVGDKLRDGRPVPPDGQLLVHVGKLRKYRAGLHACERVRDALSFAAGLTLCRVELSGQMKRHKDVVVATERRILWRIDAERILTDFAKRCAWSIRSELPDQLPVVRDFFASNDPLKRHRAAQFAALMLADPFAENRGADVLYDAAQPGGGINRAWSCAVGSAGIKDDLAGGDPFCGTNAYAAAANEQSAWLEAAAEREHLGTYTRWQAAHEPQATPERG